MNDERCETCRYLRVVPFGDDNQKAWCCRYPEPVKLESIDTAASHWCGEYEQAETEAGE